jgi:uncharacterized membrane protein YdjX (TVP38/TMEM64 family)
VLSSLWTRRFLALLLAACVLLLGLWLLRTTSISLSPAAVRDGLRRLDVSLGGLPAAPLALITALAFLLVVPIIPASALQIGSGLAFGPLWGLVYVLVADALGALAGFLLARRWALRLLGRWLKPDTVRTIEQLAIRMDWRLVILLRLLPGPAYPLVSFAAGLSRMRLRTYLLASLTGVLPSLALLVYAGDVATASPLLAVAIVVALIASLALVGKVMRKT